jgi:ribose transport system substrate-binding protein
VRQVEAERAVVETAGGVVHVRDAEDDPSRQAAHVAELLDLGAAALVVSPTRSTAISDALDLCRAAGIPVIGESIGLVHPAVVAQVRVDDLSVGRELGEVAGAAVIVDRPPRLLFVGFPDQYESSLRELGFLEGLRRHHPDVVATFVHGLAVIARAHAAVHRAAERGDLADPPDVLFGVDDESIIGAQNALRELGLLTSRLVSATFGITPPVGLEALERGDITFGAAMFAENHGRILGDLALRAVRGETLPLLTNPPARIVSARGTPRGWERYYRLDGAEYRLDIAAIEAAG